MLNRHGADVLMRVLREVSWTVHCSFHCWTSVLLWLLQEWSAARPGTTIPLTTHVAFLQHNTLSQLVFPYQSKANRFRLVSHCCSCRMTMAVATLPRLRLDAPCQSVATLRQHSMLLRTGLSTFDSQKLLDWTPQVADVELLWSVAILAFSLTGFFSFLGSRRVVLPVRTLCLVLNIYELVVAAACTRALLGHEYAWVSDGTQSSYLKDHGTSVRLTSVSIAVVLLLLRQKIY